MPRYREADCRDGAGKGDRARNVSEKFRERHAEIFGKERPTAGTKFRKTYGAREQIKHGQAPVYIPRCCI